MEVWELFGKAEASGTEKRVGIIRKIQSSKSGKSGVKRSALIFFYLSVGSALVRSFQSSKAKGLCMQKKS